MNIRFSRLMLFYFLFVSSFALGIIGYGSYYSWSNGASDFNKISNVYKANTVFDELAKGSELKEIKADVTSDGIRRALKKMEDLHKRVERVNLIAESESYESFDESVQSSKKEMTKLISFPEVSSIVGVLNRKISSFNTYVSDNNWRTLTRMSKRLKASTSSAAQASPQYYRYSTLKKTYGLISSYKKKMVALTNGSILSGEDKKSVVARLDSFDVELEMLKGFLGTYRGLTSAVKSFDNSYSKWIDETRPTLAGLRLDVESTSKNFYMGLGIFIFSFFLLTVLGVKVFKSSIKQNMQQVEEYALKLIRDGLIPFKGNVEINGTQTFRDEFERYKDYFHKRMSFGAIFQEAVPFPSILLDSNLNLVWANKLFTEEWKIGSVTESENIITWDYLQKFTNLGEDDPVFSAINQGLAGIYQIQLKLEDAEESTPYEMYVTPVSYLEQKRVMIFFYPLGSLEETLSNQRKSMIGPVMKGLDALITDSFNDEFKEKVESDFEAAGIHQVYYRFLQYREKMMMDKEVLVNEIEILNANLMKTDEAFNGLSSKLKEVNNGHGGQKEFFSIFKDSLISLAELRTGMQATVDGIFANIKTVVDSKSKISHEVEGLNSTMGEFKKVMDAINTDKEKIKQFKVEIEDMKFSMKKKFASLDRSSGQNLTKDIFPEVDMTLDKFVKTLNHMDITISKANMVMDQANTIDTKGLFSGFHNLSLNYQDNQESINATFQMMQNKEDNMINSLKQSFESYRSVKGGVSEMGAIVAGNLIESSETSSSSETSVN